jgi:hypothetical protein
METTTVPGADFDAKLSAALEKQIPQLLKAERFLTAPIAALIILGGLGAFSLGGWALKIVLEKQESDYVRKMVDEYQAQPKSALNLLSANVNKISTTLNATFESQVDSASFKALRFGCTLPGVREVGFPTCNGSLAPGGLVQALEDQTILLVANPKRQIVHLDVSVYPVDNVKNLEPILLHMFVEAPPVRATAENARRPISLEPDQLGAHGQEFLQDGRLRLFSGSSGGLGASIDLTPSLAKLGMVGPIQLRFAAERRADDGSYGPAAGRELFFLRTITYAYHKISVDSEAQK